MENGGFEGEEMSAKFVAGLKNLARVPEEKERETDHGSANPSFTSSATIVGDLKEGERDRKGKKGRAKKGCLSSGGPTPRGADLAH